ncbi:hypothetical protein QQM79_03240 [Marinobacteraceae bacterium S3BR75-40.1]
MTPHTRIPEVGLPDSERRNSPVAAEGDEELEFLCQEDADEPICYFNGSAYKDGEFVRSDRQLLKCRRGLWVPVSGGR